MRTKLVCFTAGLLLAAAAPMLAHHAFSAEYDRTKPVKVTGTVSKVEWLNPHVWFYVDVKDDTGKITTWGFSGGPPGMLQRSGITKEALKVGDVITVEGFRAKDNSTNGSGGSVTFADGRKVFTASAEETAATAKDK
ncbi:MAG: DUF6152 family protein [Bryobacteraceae bacterium]|jgi:hypothetical protein